MTGEFLLKKVIKTGHCERSVAIPLWFMAESLLLSDDFLFLISKRHAMKTNHIMNKNPQHIP
jgi:hypothetical protein